MEKVTTGKIQASIKVEVNVFFSGEKGPELPLTLMTVVKQMASVIQLGCLELERKKVDRAVPGNIHSKYTIDKDKKQLFIFADVY